MSSIYVFPGQGSQSVGMGLDLYQNNADARAVFDEMDSVLGEKLSDIIFNGPIETLTLTANVQPAILATSIAMFRAGNFATPDYVAGHSLGEYTALCAAGALSLRDAIQIVRIRGNAGAAGHSPRDRLRLLSGLSLFPRGVPDLTDRGTGREVTSDFPARFFILFSRR